MDREHFMPWLPLYCVQDDLPALLHLLGDDFAFIVSDGAGQWRAIRDYIPGDRSRTALWHIASGPLPLPGSIIEKPNGVPDAEPGGLIDDPWSGWTERRPGMDPRAPYFGEPCPGVFWLNLHLTPSERGSRCGLSSVEWSGNRYPDGARKVTVNRWAQLKRQISRQALKVPRGGLSSKAPPEVWAFPHAYGDLDAADVNPAPTRPRV